MNPDRCSDVAAGTEAAPRVSLDGAAGRPLCAFALLLAVCFVDGADVQLLPSVFRALEAELGFTPGNLGQLAMAQALFQASLAPFWGSVADSGVLSKKFLLTAGVSGWGLFTILLGTTSNIYAMLMLRCFIGAALACLLPLSQVIIASQSSFEDRGRLFGWVAFAQSMGQVSSSLFATSISNITFPLLGHSVSGWRLAFLVVGGLSVGIAMLLNIFMEEPPRRPGAVGPHAESVQAIFSDVFLRAGLYFRISSFRLIVFQGVFGTVPWNAMSFLPMFFQYVGFEDEIAAMLVMFLMLALGIGSLLGGYVGDYMAQWSRFHGRPLAAQLSIAAGIPCVLLLFAVVPPTRTSFMAYASLLWALGLLSTWVLGGVKRPILTEIVKAEDWASLLAMDTAIEGSSAALFGAPLVGLLAERCFGYAPMRGQVLDMEPEARHRNRDALATSMTWITVVPWCVCLMIWSMMHWTYQRDLGAIDAAHEIEGDIDGAQEDAPLLKLDDDGCMVTPSYY